MAVCTVLYCTYVHVYARDVSSSQPANHAPALRPPPSTERAHCRVLPPDAPETSNSLARIICTQHDGRGQLQARGPPLLCSAALLCARPCAALCARSNKASRMPLEVMLAATASTPSFRPAATRSAIQRDQRLLGTVALISHRNMGDSRRAGGKPHRLHC